MNGVAPVSGCDCCGLGELPPMISKLPACALQPQAGGFDMFCCL